MPDNPHGKPLTDAENAATEAITLQEAADKEYARALILRKRDLVSEGIHERMWEINGQIELDHAKEGNIVYTAYQELKAAKARWRKARDMKQELTRLYKAHRDMGFGG